MLQDSVETVKAAYEALARGGLDRFIEHWTDDLDHRSIEGASRAMWEESVRMARGPDRGTCDRQSPGSAPRSPPKLV
jgi:ketosteroid isomerase-like protein